MDSSTLVSGSFGLLALYAGFALGVSFLCSLLEAALLSVRVVELSGRAESGEESARRLLDIKQHRLDDALAAILTLNTVANTIGAALAGAEAGRLWGNQQVGVVSFLSVSFVTLFTAALAGGILIMSEIVPKTLGALYASRLVGFVSRMVAVMTWSLKPLLFVTRSITRLLSRGRATPTMSRGDVEAMVNMATRDGALDEGDSRLLASVLRQAEIVVEDVMTPRTVVTMMPQSTTIGDFLRNENSRVYSRIPIFDRSHDDVSGFVLQRDVLVAAAEGAEPDTPIATFARPALHIPEGLTVGRVLRRLIEKREHMGLVTDEYGGLSGVVTLEDVVETTLGVEIIDESDRVVDLRAEADKLRQQRLEGMRRWRQALGVDSAASDTAASEGGPPTPRAP